MTMFDGFTRTSVRVGDVDITAVVGGSGPPVLMLHGFPQTHALWARVAPFLATEFTVVCADLRGYGDSSKPPDTSDHASYSFRAMAADQLGLMRALGFPRFHVAGHDRGGRTAYRMALDHAEALISLTVMDIVPTAVMLTQTNRNVAHAYWHWYFLSQPAPFPERLIAADPDYFYETCLVGWGASRLADFDREQLDAYRRSWRDADMIRGSCGDYRAAASIDLEHDLADAGRVVDMPTLVLYGADGVMAGLFDIPAEWRKLCSDMEAKAMPGGHFFIDLHPVATAATLRAFLSRTNASAVPATSR